MTHKHLDEAYIQLAIDDNPDLPEDFIRKVVKSRQEPLIDYSFYWIRDQYEAVQAGDLNWNSWFEGEGVTEDFMPGRGLSDENKRN